MTLTNWSHNLKKPRSHQHKSRSTHKRKLIVLRSPDNRSRDHQRLRSRWHRERLRREEEEEVVIATATATLSQETLRTRTPRYEDGAVAQTLPSHDEDAEPSDSLLDVPTNDGDTSSAFSPSPLPPMPLTQVAITDSLADTHGIPLSRYGFITFATSDAGGARDADDVKSRLRTVIKILLNVHQRMLHSAAMTMAVPPEPLDIVSFAIYLVRESTMHNHLLHYLAKYPWKANTMCQHLYMLKDFYQWLRQVPQVASVSDYDVRRLAFYKFVIDPVIRTAKKSVRKTKRNSDTSKATAVFEGRHPAGGLADCVSVVQAAANEQLLRFTGEGVIVTNISHDAYVEFMEVFFAALWSLAPQGRAGGVESLQYRHVEQFISDGYALSGSFKTAETYTYQPVILAPLTKRLLLEVYIPFLRPLVQPQRGGSPARDDPLFFTYSGTSTVLPGRLVSSFFRRKLDIMITITTIRGMIETDVAERRARGEISEEGRNAILEVNGHSQAIAKEFYVTNQFETTTRLAAEAYGLASLVPSMGPIAPLEVEQWGIDHPDRSVINDKSRARWTPQEKEYLLAVADDIICECGGVAPERLMKNCLQRIKEDQSTRRIFHKRHIMTTDRLRTGYRQAREEATTAAINTSPSNLRNIRAAMAATVATVHSAII
jgi:hypothetical protein